MIENYAFSGCVNLKAELPGSVEIKSSAFQFCGQVTSKHIDDIHFAEAAIPQMSFLRPYIEDTWFEWTMEKLSCENMKKIIGSKENVVDIIEFLLSIRLRRKRVFLFVVYLPNLGVSKEESQHEILRYGSATKFIYAVIELLDEMGSRWL